MKRSILVVTGIVGMLSMAVFCVIGIRYCSYSKIQKKEKVIQKIEDKINKLEKKKAENEKERQKIKEESPEKIGILEVWEEEVRKEEKANS